MVGLQPWVAVGLVVVFGAIGLADARRVGARWPDLRMEQVLGKARHLILAALLLVPLFVAHFVLDQRPDLFWHLPLWLELRYLAIVWGSIIGLFSYLFGFGLTIAFRTGHHERWKLAVAAALLVGAVQLAQWRFTRPVAARLADHVTPEGIVMQSSDVSCAAASGANIARALGIAQSEREMAERFGTTEMGTSAAQVVYGFASLGVMCAKRTIAGGDLGQLRPPAMLFVDNAAAGPDSHAVALVPYAGRDQVIDPATGSAIEPATLARVWHGRAVECHRAR